MANRDNRSEQVGALAAVERDYILQMPEQTKWKVNG